MFFMHFEILQPGLEKRLHFAVFDVRDEGIGNQIVDRLVIAELVLGIEFVEGLAAQLAHRVDQLVRIGHKLFAQEIILRLGP